MNLGDFKTLALQRLGIDTTETARVTQLVSFVNAERRRLVARLGLNETSTGIDFTANQQTVDLGATVQEIISLHRATAAGDAALMQPVTDLEFARLWAGETAGTLALPTGPAYYLLERRSNVTNPDVLRVWPTPTTTTAGGTGATMRYRLRPADLSADADIPNELPIEYHDVLGELAVWRLAHEQGAWDIAQGARAVADEIISELEAAMRRRVGRVQHRIPLRGYR